jgi:hypothetical protein
MDSDGDASRNKPDIRDRAPNNPDNGSMLPHVCLPRRREQRSLGNPPPGGNRLALHAAEAHPDMLPDSSGPNGGGSVSKKNSQRRLEYTDTATH